MQGWIKLHRCIRTHWIYNEKPFSKFQAWVDILLMANHEDRKLLLGNELVEIKRGSFITSEAKLMERWGWSKSKVRNFLNLLHTDNMIIKESDTKKTAITVVNYSDYQDKETTKELPKDQEETAKEPRKDPNKNVKELKNVKEDKYICSSPDERECVEAPAEKPSDLTEDGGAQDIDSSGKGEYTQDFEEFWSFYPRRVEKKRAYRIFKTRVREGTSPDVLTRAASNYAQYCKTNDIGQRYIKHPGTFLGPDKPFEEFIKGVPEFGTDQHNTGQVGENRARTSKLEKNRFAGLARDGGTGQIA